ncbi:MAG: tRNA (cytidine(34)-2'-O)-methyltransferase [Eubacteriales bacterium]|nr:tRNA (cytidine(34)-2'-O)-methyltransferase [Eubacteriales bacterium]
MIEIVLIEPEIPQNTGNIARTCVATGSRLHLVEPLGFSISDRQLKRAGLDYWFDLDLTVWPDFDSWQRAFAGKNLFYATTKAPRTYAEPTYRGDTVLVFGKETKGLPESLLQAHPERCIRIPMQSESRSLNLANAVAIVTYEVLRQQGFPGLLLASDFL